MLPTGCSSPLTHVRHGYKGHHSWKTWGTVAGWLCVNDTLTSLSNFPLLGKGNQPKMLQPKLTYSLLHGLRLAVQPDGCPSCLGLSPWALSFLDFMQAFSLVQSFPIPFGLDFCFSEDWADTMAP